MKVGDLVKVGALVKHWMLSTYGIGVIVEKEQRGHTTSYKVQWSVEDAGCGWYDHDRLEVISESR